MVYFASDFHLGAPDYAQSRIREDRIVDWLNHIRKDAEEIFLVGDVFDFWFDYKHAVPRGYVRLLGKLAEITDSGIPVHFFLGNHDMWMKDYLTKEIGIILHKDIYEVNLSGKQFFIGHGDGLGPGDYSYKILKKIFRNPVLQWCFGWIHPNIGIGLAGGLSRRSRASQGDTSYFLGADKEWLLQYSERKLGERPDIDYFVFGHRHLPLDMVLANGQSRYINLGEWIHARTYGAYDGQNFKLETWPL